MSRGDPSTCGTVAKFAPNGVCGRSQHEQMEHGRQKCTHERALERKLRTIERAQLDANGAGAALGASEAAAKPGQCGEHSTSGNRPDGSDHVGGHGAPRGVVLLVGVEDDRKRIAAL